MKLGPTLKTPRGLEVNPGHTRPNEALTLAGGLWGRVGSVTFGTYRSLCNYWGGGLGWLRSVGNLYCTLQVLSSVPDHAEGKACLAPNPSLLLAGFQ